ncbi:uncharacterized protein SPSK_01234 [Sporothrix schenckii 1099-18]|uniref:Uncharacterized protein n=2 Tax=Sporothrix schenckii TaxID=29908 RepID=U7PMD6_SPOS1|nr:uncharacterized protein SPSK_01234 [Sporothrix schenckii 1099-18]ERS96808.1 hypothetical protein HMPREF1624_07017 [Sporothrix schenckii ATCC 58251]KJR81540.1 hypothetical protein SPSK_01234 [Sporothrix schenckii 1099-18]
MPAPFRPVQPIIWINGWPAMGKLALAQCICQLLGQDRAVVIDDREFTDQLNLPRDALMSRHVSRSGGRPRGLSVGDINGNTHTHRYNVCSEAGADGGICPGKECPGRGCPGRECMGGRLMTGLDGLSPPLQAKQEACFRKFVYGDEDDEAIKNGKVDAVQRQRVIIFTDCRANDKVGAEGARRYENAARNAGRQFVPIYVECLPEEQERRAKSSDKLYTQVEGAAMTGAEAARELQALADGRLFTFPQDTVPGLYINVTNQLIHDSAMEVISFINAIAEKRTDAVKESVAASVRRRHGIFVAWAIEN